METVVLTYTVASNRLLKITGAICWGDYDGEFLVRVSGVIRGGGRTDAAHRTLYLPYAKGKITVPAGATATISVTHYAPSDRLFRSNLLAELH
jgi:hypothetical protein